LERETDAHLLTTLVCPLTGAPLELSKDRTELISTAAKLAFPIRDGIPIMIESEARHISEADKSARS